MVHVFDPYYDWLGISPEEQPANYYRLLGVKLFEQRETVISNAADQRMAFLRTQQHGSHSKESQKLLNELSKARVTLLNPEQKRIYDEQLRIRIADQERRKKAKEVPPPVPRQPAVKYPVSTKSTSTKNISELETQVFTPFQVPDTSSMKDTVEFSQQESISGKKSKTRQTNSSKDRTLPKNMKSSKFHHIAQVFCIVSVVLAILLGVILAVKLNGKVDKNVVVQEETPQIDEQTLPLPGDRLVKTLNGVEFAFRWCPEGEFEMGSPEGEDGRNGQYEFQHKVLIKKGFWIMEIPVTQAQWEAVMHNNPSYFKGETQPVEQVSYLDCQNFCQTCVGLGLSLAVPSEAQWEYACRAGTATRFNFGDSAQDFYKYGNYCDVRCDETQIKNPNSKDKEHDDGFVFTSDVDSYPPNAWGIKDMHGNVWEWCADAWSPNLKGRFQSEPVVDSNTDEHPLHGGSWSSVVNACRSANRHHAPSSAKANCIGFRCILEE